MVLAVLGATLFVLAPRLEDYVVDRLRIEVDYATVAPEGSITTILTGLPKEVSVSVDVAVTNDNLFDIALHDLELTGYVNESAIAEARPTLPTSPLPLPAGETVTIAIKTTVPTRAAAVVPIDILRTGDLELRVEGVATGEAFGRRVSRPFEITGVDLRLQPTLKL